MKALEIAGLILVSVLAGAGGQNKASKRRNSNMHGTRAKVRKAFKELRVAVKASDRLMARVKKASNKKFKVLKLGIVVGRITPYPSKKSIKETRAVLDKAYDKADARLLLMTDKEINSYAQLADDAKTAAGDLTDLLAKDFIIDGGKIMAWVKRMAKQKVAISDGKTVTKTEIKKLQADKPKGAITPNLEASIVLSATGSEGKGLHAISADENTKFSRFWAKTMMQTGGDVSAMWRAISPRNDHRRFVVWACRSQSENGNPDAAVSLDGVERFRKIAKDIGVYPFLK
ncbi:MAG: hypothetical protein V3V10_07180 [Planctomycetota bacterium]